MEYTFMEQSRRDRGKKGRGKRGVLLGNSSIK